VTRKPLQIGLIVLLTMLSGAIASAQSDGLRLMKVGRVYLDEIVPAPEGALQVQIYLRAETLIGEPLHQLGPSMLSIRDNGEIIDSALVELSLLAEAGVGTSAVLVLDTSRTMRGAPFDEAKAAALKFLDQMSEFDHVAVVAFDDDVRVVSEFGSPRTQTQISIEELEIQPKTLSKLVWDGAEKGVELLRERPEDLPRRAFVILFSDGRDSNSVHALSEVIDIARGQQGEGRIPIFTIGYSRFGGTGLENLDELSLGTGASSFQAVSPEELGRFFNEIWKRMTQSFVVTYPTAMDGVLHTIDVTIEDRSDSRDAIYPDISTPIWPWILGLIVLLAGGAGGYLFLQSRSAGQLVFEGGTRSGQIVPIKGSAIRIGALDENELVLNFPTISRYHAKVHVKGGAIEVEDLGSRNGTFVNGTMIRVRCEVNPGDRLRFGDVEMVYRK
jgi:uncharacterized protein YegL